MSKSNIIVTVVLAALSILLLGLWYFQGFSATDPLDLVLAVVWWVVIAIGAVLVAKVGKTNR